MQQIAYQLVAVLTGAVCGAMFRYKLAERFDNGDFYYGTFTTNVAACAVLALSGFMAGVSNFDLTNLCMATLAGTMSTYSSFAYQIAKDIQKRLFKKAFVYAATTLFTSLLVYFFVAVLIALAKSLMR